MADLYDKILQQFPNSPPITKTKQRKSPKPAANAVNSRLFSFSHFWRWAELNPRPKTRRQRLLPSQSVFRNSPRRAQTDKRAGQVASWVLFTLQSLGAKVPHLSMPDSAAVSDRGLTAALIKPQMLNYYCRFFLRFGLLTQLPLRMAIRAFKIPVETITPPLLISGYSGTFIIHKNQRLRKINRSK